MKDTKLSDFNQLQLETMLAALVSQRELAEGTVYNICKSKMLARLLKARVKRYEEEIEASREIEVHVAYALKEKIEQVTIESN